MSTWVDEKGTRHVGVMLNGRRVHRRLPKGASASDAKRIEAEIRNAVGQRRVAIPGDPYLSQVMDLYLEHAKNLRSPDTARFHALRLGPWLEGVRASEAPAAAQAIKQDMAGHYAPATINRSLGTLTKALTLVWERGQTPQNYGLRIKRLPENNARDTTLTIQQVKAIADKASEQVRAAIWIAFYTGCRRGEMLALKPEDIGDEAITIRAANTKTQSTRVIPIVQPLRPWLKAIPLAINFEGLKTGFRRARKAAGMPEMTFHDLRRSTATQMIAAGVDLYVVSKVLGHSSVAVTQKRYAHLYIDRIREGMERTFAPRITPRRKRAL